MPNACQLMEAAARHQGCDDSVLTAFELAPSGGLEARIGELLKLGFNRVLFLIVPPPRPEQWPLLDRYAALVRKFA